MAEETDSLIKALEAIVKEMHELEGCVSGVRLAAVEYRFIAVANECREVCAKAVRGDRKHLQEVFAAEGCFRIHRLRLGGQAVHTSYLRMKVDIRENMLAAIASVEQVLKDSGSYHPWHPQPQPEKLARSPRVWLTQAGSGAPQPQTARGRTTSEDVATGDDEDHLQNDAVAAPPASDLGDETDAVGGHASEDVSATIGDNGVGLLDAGADQAVPADGSVADVDLGEALRDLADLDGASDGASTSTATASGIAVLDCSSHADGVLEASDGASAGEFEAAGEASDSEAGEPQACGAQDVTSMPSESIASCSDGCSAGSQASDGASAGEFEAAGEASDSEAGEPQACGAQDVTSMPSESIASCSDGFSAGSQVDSVPEPNTTSLDVGSAGPTSAQGTLLSAQRRTRAGAAATPARGAGKTATPPMSARGKPTSSATPPLSARREKTFAPLPPKLWRRVGSPVWHAEGGAAATPGTILTPRGDA